MPFPLLAKEKVISKEVRNFVEEFLFKSLGGNSPRLGVERSEFQSSLGMETSWVSLGSHILSALQDGSDKKNNTCK